MIVLPFSNVIADLEERIEVWPKLWITKSKFAEEILDHIATSFREVANDEIEDDKLRQRLIDVAKVAMVSDAEEALERREAWAQTLTEAVEARKKEFVYYQRTLGKLRPDHKREFRKLVRRVSDLFERARSMLAKLNRLMKRLDAHLMDN